MANLDHVAKLTVAQQTAVTFTSTTTQINLVTTPGSSSSAAVFIQCSTNTIGQVTIKPSTQSGGNWLATPEVVLGSNGIFNLGVSAIAIGLAAGTYSGTVVVGSFLTTATLSIPVVFTVIPPVPLSASPSAFVFNTSSVTPNSNVPQTLTMSASLRDRQ